MSNDPATHRALVQAVDIIEKWKAEAALITDNGFRTNVMRCFEALKSMNGTDVVDLEFHLVSMRSAREIAKNYDSNMVSHELQEFYYGFSEVIEKTMETLISRLKEKEKQGRLAPPQPLPQPIRHPPNAPYLQIPAMPSPLTNYVPSPSALPSATTPRSKSNGIRTLSCTRCPATGLHISGFVNHLRNAHNTTPGLEKVGFRCACGYMAFSYKNVWEHSNKCRNCHLTVINKLD